MSNTPLVNTRGRALEPSRTASCCGGQIFCSKGTSISLILTERPAGCNLGRPHLQVPAAAYSSRTVAHRLDLRARPRRVPAAARPYPAEPDRPGNAAVPIRGQGAAGGEYRESMRVHTPVRRTGGAVPPLPREGPCCTGLSRQRFRRPGTRRQPRHRQILRDELRCELSDVREIRRVGGQRQPLVRNACRENWPAPRVELPQIPDRPFGRESAVLRQRGNPRRPQARGRDRADAVRTPTLDAASAFSYFLAGGATYSKTRTTFCTPPVPRATSVAASASSRVTNPSKNTTPASVTTLISVGRNFPFPMKLPLTLLVMLASLLRDAAELAPAICSSLTTVFTCGISLTIFSTSAFACAVGTSPVSSAV